MSATQAAAEPASAEESTSEAGGLAEITVTAQRRSESVQDVPITVQAITGDSLKKLNVSTFDDVIRLLPNVTFSANGPGQGNIYMRGLSAGFAGNQVSAAVAPFPNVATYLDEQSMTFPARNADIYMVDMERVEVLEGPQGTLFGGGAEAGVLRYITNKPKLDRVEGNAEASYGVTAHGDPNTMLTATINLPIIADRLAFRASIYNDRRGGYIDNVPSTFTRKLSGPIADNGPSGYGWTPALYAAAIAANPSSGSINNNFLARRAQNPVTYTGVRAAALYQINDDWNVLVQQSYQNLDAEGMGMQFPAGSDGQTLGSWEETSFAPAYDKDKYSATAWTLNGEIADYKLLYTGSYLTRHIDQAMDYTNYTRTNGGFYYQCTGGPTSGSTIGAGTNPICYSPVYSWHDRVGNTHQSHEFRFTTPEHFWFRGLFGVFWEDLQIRDDMNFDYKTIPSCTQAGLANAIATNTVCITNVVPINAAVDPTMRGDNTAFGVDLRRGYQQTALFTSVDFDIIPKRLTLTAGTRWFQYKEDEVGSQYASPACVGGVANPTVLNGSPGCGGAAPIGAGLDVDPVTGKNAEFHRATYSGFRSRANLTWHITQSAMVYYTFSQGYRPGVFNRTTGGRSPIAVDASGVPLPNGVPVPPGSSKPKQFLKPFAYPPDSLTNSEIGFKTEFLDHRLLFNGSLYQMNWKDVQTLIFNRAIYGNTTFGVQGPTYRVRGFELQGAAKVTHGLTVQGTLSYNNSKQTNNPCIRSAGLTLRTPGNPTPAGACITQVYSANAGTNMAVQNALGAPGSVPAFSPKMQYNLRARYDWFFNDYDTFVMAGMTHVDKMDNEPSSFLAGSTAPSVPSTTWLRYTMPGYELYDASVGVSKGNWSVEAYGQNLANKNASLFTSTSQFILSEVPTRPRVLGVKVTMNF